MTPTMKASYYARFPRKKRPLKFPPAAEVSTGRRHPRAKSAKSKQSASYAKPRPSGRQARRSAEPDPSPASSPLDLPPTQPTSRKLAARSWSTSCFSSPYSSRLPALQWSPIGEKH